MSRSYSVQSLRYSAYPPDFCASERITWQDGQTVKRFMSLSEFCQRYDRHRDTVLYHAQHKRVYVFRVRHRWWVELSRSYLPEKRRQRAQHTYRKYRSPDGTLERQQ